MISPHSILQAVNDRLRVWWDGAYIPPDNRGNSGLVILQGHYEQHWTSHASHVALDYFKAHHQWIIGIAVAIVLAMAVKMRCPPWDFRSSNLRWMATREHRVC